MKEIRIYISMPITGYDMQERMATAEKAKKLAIKKYKRLHPDDENENQHITCISPFDVCPETDLSYAEYIGRDITALMECDMVAFCEGWEKSRGCRIEHSVTYEMGIRRTFVKISELA